MVLVLAHVVEQAAERHELRDEHHLHGHAHRQNAHAARVLDGGHHARLLQQLLVLVRRPLLQHLDGHRDLHILTFRDPVTLRIITQLIGAVFTGLLR